MRRSGLTGVNDEFMLHQTRVWCDARINDWLKMRGGFIDAASFGEDIPPRAHKDKPFRPVPALGRCVTQRR